MTQRLLAKDLWEKERTNALTEEKNQSKYVKESIDKHLKF